MTTIKTGRVKFFNSQKGYGFVVPDKPIEGNAEVFVHHTVIHNNGGFKSLAEGESVEFDVVRGPKGLQATRVTGPNGSCVRGDPYMRVRPKPLVISAVNDNASSPSSTSPYYAYSPYPPGYAQILPYGAPLGHHQPQFSAFAYPAAAQQQSGSAFAIQPGHAGDSRVVVAAPQPILPSTYFGLSHLPNQQQQQHSQLQAPQHQQLPMEAAVNHPYESFARQLQQQQPQRPVLYAYEPPTTTYVMPDASMASHTASSQQQQQQQNQLPPPHSSSPIPGLATTISRQGSKASLLSSSVPFTGFPE
ncbi:hypothetical protein H4R26_000738 [Coemansia thaxteri]|uniref:CSD domain-containing protein n=1 Tax=Coemansia thaxteri TaxID=2663907 RepID=A0A9W8BNE1_9FUNG|nr:hypothetical protein H4R26_000738 [Coemansia thaxteri]KAJ2482311.1 hypothetical protein EV174_003246 [Coemansia sp. RSA 2320]